MHSDSRTQTTTQNIQTEIEEAGAEETGGVLLCNIEILALDKPTSDLDSRGRRELRELLSRLPVTQIIATHDLELVVELYPRVIMLDSGRKVADRPTIELLNNEPLMLDHGLERAQILRHWHPHS